MTEVTFSEVNLSQSYLTIAEDSFVAELRLAADADWQEAVHHRFVLELFDGSLSDAVLASYLIQDYQFFDAGIAMMGACVAQTDDATARLRFSRQLAMLTSDEDGYFQRSFVELGVAESDITTPALKQPTQDFLSVMWRMAHNHTYAELLIFILVAEWIYLDWGELDRPLPSAAKHLDWVYLHRGEDFQGWVQFLVDELNRITPDLSPADKTRLTDLFKQTVATERAFFDAAYNE